MRGTVTIAMILVGFVLQAASYLWWAAPIGKPSGPAFSDPRVPFAAGIFIVGVMLVFLAAVVYELMPEQKGR